MEFQDIAYRARHKDLDISEPSHSAGSLSAKTPWCGPRASEAGFNNEAYASLAMGLEARARGLDLSEDVQNTKSRKLLAGEVLA